MLLRVIVLGLALFAALERGADAQAPATRYPKFKVLSVTNKPFFYYADDDETTAPLGMIPDLLKTMGEKMGFEYEFVLPEDRKYGNYDEETNTWNGMIGDVLAGKADFIAADLTKTAPRAQVLDFTEPFMMTPLTVLAKTAPASFRGSVFFFFEPFTWDAWILLALFFVITALTLWIAARISPYEHWSNRVVPVFTLPNSFWFVFSVFFRGSNFTPRTCSTRLIAGVWYIFGLCILILYGIGLNSHVRSQVSGSRSQYTNLRQIINDPDIKLGVYCCGSTQAFLNRSQFPLHQKLYAKVAPVTEEDPQGGFFLSNAAGVERVLETEDASFAYIMEGAAASYARREDCSLYNVGNLDTRNFAFAFPRQTVATGGRRPASYKNDFSVNILSLKSIGRMQQLINTHWTSDRDCERRSTQIGYGVCTELDYSLHLGNLYWAFLLLLIFLIVGLILSVLELVTFIRNNPSSEKTGARITKHLKYAFMGCNKTSPDEGFPRNKESQT